MNVVLQIVADVRLVGCKNITVFFLSIFIFFYEIYFHTCIRNEKKALEEEMNRRSVRDMEARQQCFKGECEIRQLKKEMRKDKLQLKTLEQQIAMMKSKSNN